MKQLKMKGIAQRKLFANPSIMYSSSSRHIMFPLPTVPSHPSPFRSSFTFLPLHNHHHQHAHATRSLEAFFTEYAGLAANCSIF